MNKYLDIAPEVQAALAEGKPVVALESTIISHSMPYPKKAVIQAPEEILPACPVPYARKREDDQKVEQRPFNALPVAAERYIYVFPEEG